MQSYFARILLAVLLLLVASLAAIAQPYTAPPAAGSGGGGYVPSLNADGGAPSHVTNFPSTQTVAGSVGLSGTLPAFASPPTVNLGSGVTLGGTLPAFGATPTFNLGTAPSLTIGNFPATQPISATSLPLPAGAATAANQYFPTLNGDGGAPAHVTNFPTIQAIVGANAAGSTANTAPVQVGGVDGSGNVRALLTDTSGRSFTVPGNSPGTDSSANSPSGLSTTLTSFTVTTPGAYYVQNQSAAPIQVDLCTSVGVNCTIVLLASGGAAGAQGADTTPPIPWFTGYVAVVGASGSQIAARHN
jgi:hypothetical protein